MHRLWICLIAVALAAPVRADEVKFDAEAAANKIAPFVDPQTVAVCRIDVTRFNVADLFDKVATTTGVDRKELKVVQEELTKWGGTFTKAGGREIFVLLSLADVPLQAFAVVPLPDGADADAL